LQSADVAVVGPGLGQDDWGEALWRRTLASDLPLVVDADGLNLLARQPSARGHWILTPHPGEAGRLLGSGAGAVQRDRAAAARALVDRYGGVAVLKGARTLVATRPDAPLAVCDRGNPGMGSGGMGDVLAGVLGALVAQCGGDLERATRAGVLLHALAGDAAAVGGERGTIASDLFPHLRRWANPS
jgi:NAD(P)H-hydrate epimerase